MPPAPMITMGRSCFGRGCRTVCTAAAMRASRFSVVEGFGITGSPCEMLPKGKPLVNRVEESPNRYRLLSPRRLFSGILDGPLDNRSGLNAHHCRTSLIEMEGILEKISMLGHKSV